MTVSVDCFTRQLDCTYEDERYSVRDNGAIFRHPRPGARSRRADANWTFGKANLTAGYLELTSVRVHRIVATAFHGEPPTRQHVVDHIDTNRHNNRPENLRWVTRLENVLLNPITAKRIALMYGSVEAFLADPRQPPINGVLDKNWTWMRTVSEEEALLSLERLTRWAESGRGPSGGKLDDWLYNRGQPLAKWQAQSAVTRPSFVSTNSNGSAQRDQTVPAASPVRPPLGSPAPQSLVPSNTHGAAQRNWTVPADFPACPPPGTSTPLEAYAAHLQPGTTFCVTRYNRSEVLQVAFSADRRSLWVLCEFADEAIKPWSLAKITYEDDQFVHANEGTFLGRDGADKYFTLGQGLEWTGGEVHDDFV